MLFTESQTRTQITCRSLPFYEREWWKVYNYCVVSTFKLSWAWVAFHFWESAKPTTIKMSGNQNSFTPMFMPCLHLCLQHVYTICIPIKNTMFKLMFAKCLRISLQHVYTYLNTMFTHMLTACLHLFELHVYKYIYTYIFTMFAPMLTPCLHLKS